MAPAELGRGLQGRQEGPTSMAPGPASLRAHLERWPHSLVAGVQAGVGRAAGDRWGGLPHSVPGLEDIGE